MEEVRLRLAFERSILDDDQKAQGIKRCWLLLKPKLHKTIASLSSYIIESFNFQQACPFGLSLSMDGYFLPPFESTSVFHDKDIVRVKRKENDLKIDNENVNVLSNGAADCSQSKSKEEEHNSDEEHNIDSLRSSDVKAAKKRKFHSSLEKSYEQKKQKVVIDKSPKKDTKSIQLRSKSPSRSARRKKAKRKWLREHRKLPTEQADQSVLPKASDSSAKTSDDCDKSEESDKSSEDEEEIVPVVIKPGHIRFQSAKIDYIQHDEEEFPMVKYQWNNTNKKKGQRWGIEKDNNSKWIRSNPATIVEENEEEDALLNFDNMDLYKCSPKVGDVIAYKMMVLTSSWSPEISSYRVGKIAEYDVESDRIVLMPVEEYPLPRKEEGDEYSEEGILELCFASLVDVRLVGGKKSDLNEQKEDENSVLEELRVMVEKKKKEIAEDAKRSGNCESFKRKGFRSGALGPLLARLRSELTN